MGITLDQLVFDTANPDDGANVGSYVRAGDDGTQIGHVGDALKVDIGSVTDLDIRDLDATQDNVAISDGTDTLAVNADGSINSVVTATDLDIRDLSDSTDSVAIGDGTDTLAIEADGSINVNFSSAVADDEADTENGLKGAHRAKDGLLTAVSANNDKADQISDMYRRQYVNSSPNVGMQTSTSTVGTTQVELAASPLAGRTRILVQNNGTRAIYVGPTGVTTANGIRIPRRSSMELPWGEDIDLFAISAAAGQDVRVMEVG